METMTKHLRPFAVKGLDVEGRTFEGLASTWELDKGDDVIHEGAFATTLNEWRRKGRIIPLIDGHNYGSVRNVLGKLTDAQETKAGLWTKWEVIEGDAGDDVLRLLKGGYLDALSIGYRPVKWEMEVSNDAQWGEIRHLKEVELKEVSLVLWPMNDGARVDLATVKSLLGATELTDAEKAELRALLADPAIPAPEGLAAGEQDEGAPDVGRLDRLRLACITI